MVDSQINQPKEQPRFKRVGGPILAFLRRCPRDEPFSAAHTKHRAQLERGPTGRFRWSAMIPRGLDVTCRGLVRFWAKDIKVRFANINAKAEGIGLL